MTNEELLKPRFKLIQDYPGNTREVGSVSTEIATADYFRKYTKNFKELEWWEERTVEQMPKFLKIVTIINGNNHIGHIIHAVAGSYKLGFDGYREENGFVSGFDNIILSCFRPATEEEYLKQNK